MWTYRQLHDEVWERTFFTGPTAVQSVVKRLRRKLESAGMTPAPVQTSHGAGYYFSTLPQAPGVA